MPSGVKATLVPRLASTLNCKSQAIFLFEQLMVGGTAVMKSRRPRFGYINAVSPKQIRDSFQSRASHLLKSDGSRTKEEPKHSYESIGLPDTKGS
jgi:hypothetical protein